MKSIRPKSDSDDFDGSIVEAIGCMVMTLAIISLLITMIAVIPKAISEHMEEQAAILKAERYTIEGTISHVEQLNRPDPFEDDRDENGDPKPGIRIHITHQSNKFTRIHFKDGRHHDFDGLYSKPFPIDEYVIIEYDGIGKVVSIEPKE
tara:strand:+ start:58576 stop:59022 length:447 start_codon:yes stop_codon:yes gene_type:complete